MAEEAELSGRAAIVTGASHGAGRAIAHALAKAGARVVLTGPDAEAGRAAASAIEAEGGEALFVAADPGRDGDWAKAVESVEARFGRLDVLAVCPAATAAAPTAGLSHSDFRAANDTNLKGPFLGLKHGVAAMRRGGRGGSVIFVASVAGRVGLNHRLAETGAMAGVRLLAKAAALELGPEGIRVNTIQPGLADADDTPLGRPVAPADVAQAAVYLASDRSIFMTGADIVVDGGWTIR